MSLIAGAASPGWLEASARVEALLPQGARVSVVTQSGCDGCASQKSCGAGVLTTQRHAHRRHLTVVTSRGLTVGQTVRIGLPARRFLMGALAVYALPLLAALLAGGAAEAWLAPGSPWVPMAFLAGLAGGGVGLLVWGRYRPSACRPLLLDPSPP